MKQILSSVFENEAKAFVLLRLQEVMLPEMGLWRKIMNIRSKHMLSWAFENEAKAFVRTKGE